MSSTAYEEHFKRVKNMSCLRLCFLLPTVIDGGESIFLKDHWSTYNSAKIRQISISLLSMSIKTRVSHLVKKNRSQKISLGCHFKLPFNYSAFDIHGIFAQDSHTLFTQGLNSKLLWAQTFNYSGPSIIYSVCVQYVCDWQRYMSTE